MFSSKLNLLLLLILGTSMSNCVSYSKSEIRKQLVDLEKDKLSDLEGIYSFNFVESYQIGSAINIKEVIPEAEWQSNAYDFTLNNADDSRLLFMSEVNNNDQYQISLKVENDEELRIGVLENSIEIMSTSVKGKYKKGMFYLDENFQDCNGIPYLFGGCYTNSRRIGLTQNGNLLVNRAVNDSGAVLFLMRNGYDYNVSYEYQRTESKISD